MLVFRSFYWGQVQLIGGHLLSHKWEKDKRGPLTQCCRIQLLVDMVCSLAIQSLVGRLVLLLWWTSEWDSEQLDKLFYIWAYIVSKVCKFGIWLFLCESTPWYLVICTCFYKGLSQPPEKKRWKSFWLVYVLGYLIMFLFWKEKWKGEEEVLSNNAIRCMLKTSNLLGCSFC